MIGGCPRLYPQRFAGCTAKASAPLKLLSDCGLPEQVSIACLARVDAVNTAWEGRSPVYRDRRPGLSTLN
jgi:hypothetical protein